MNVVPEKFSEFSSLEKYECLKNILLKLLIDANMFLIRETCNCILIQITTLKFHLL